MLSLFVQKKKIRLITNRCDVEITRGRYHDDDVSVEIARWQSSSYPAVLKTMWETTFPRNSHAGLGKPINEDDILPSMHETSFSPCPIRRGYFSEVLFPTWVKELVPSRVKELVPSRVKELVPSRVKELVPSLAERESVVCRGNLRSCYKRS